MNVIITGAAIIDNYELVCKAIQKAIIAGWHITGVITSEEYSIDHLIVKWAKENKIEVKTVNADWKNHGYYATILRNREMIEAADGLILIRANTKELEELRQSAYLGGLKILDIS